MARTFTVAQLVTRAKQRADMENSDFVSDSEWQLHLSTAYGELYSILVESGLRYFETEDTITTTGVATYSLPADFLSTIGVDYEIDSQGRRRALFELMAQERNAYLGIAGAGYAVGYALVGSDLLFSPNPPTGQTYYHTYAPQPTDLSGVGTGTSVDVVTPDGEAFLSWYMAHIALAKEEADTRVAYGERERARERLEEWATLRSLNQPRRRQVSEELGFAEDADWRLFY